MAVRIRLARAGAKKAPFYRVVVTDSRSPRDGRFIEIVGRYNPRTTPTLVDLELDKIKEWIAKGASPSETVEKLIAIAEAPDAPAPETVKDGKVSKKQQALEKAAEAKEAEPAQEAPAEDEAPAEEEPAAEEAAPEDEAPAEEEPAAEEAPAEEAAPEDEALAEEPSQDDPADEADDKEDAE